jgi:hypothetical protein
VLEPRRFGEELEHDLLGAAPNCIYPHLNGCMVSVWSVYAGGEGVRVNVCCGMNEAEA